MSSKLVQAIKNLAPTAEFTISDGQVEWVNPSVAPVTDEQIAAEVARIDAQTPIDNCKAQAVQLLNETDWTTIPDVANPSDSNPYLTNQREFMTWRSAIRQLAVNPVADPVWPTQPTPQWGNKS